MSVSPELDRNPLASFEVGEQRGRDCVNKLSESAGPENLSP